MKKLYTPVTYGAPVLLDLNAAFPSSHPSCAASPTHRYAQLSTTSADDSNVYVPVSRAMKKPWSRMADCSASKDEPWSSSWRRVFPLGQFGVAKVRRVSTPEKSGVRDLKKVDVKPLFARLAS